MDLLNSLLDNYNIPILSAFVLGLMTAISPCPLATNITATAFISKNISSKRKVFLSGILYSLGRGFSYTAIGLLLFFESREVNLLFRRQKIVIKSLTLRKAKDYSI